MIYSTNGEICKNLKPKAFYFKKLEIISQINQKTHIIKKEKVLWILKRNKIVSMRLNGMIASLQGVIDAALMSFVVVATKKRKIPARMRRIDTDKGFVSPLFVLKLLATIKRG